MNRAALRRGFASLEMLYWLTYGAFTTYLVSFVTTARGGSASVAGLMLALFMGSACAGQIVIGGLCDRRQNNRVVFMAGMALVIAIQAGVFFAPNWITLGCAYVALGFIQPPMAALLDTWLIHSFPDEPNAYAPLRALGSLAYAGLMLAMGFVIERIGHFMMPILSTLFALAAIAVASRMPEIPRVAEAKAADKVRLKTLPAAVWLFVVCMAVLGAANNPLINMNLLILQSVGGTVANAGIATSFNTVAEFIAMRYPRLFSRFDARAQLTLAGILYIVSTAMMLLSRGFALLYAASFVNGIAYGVLLPARRRLVGEITPAEAHNRVHALSDMAYLNFGGLVGNQVSGLIIDSLGVRVMLCVAIGVQLIGVGGLTVLNRRLRRA